MTTIDMFLDSPPATTRALFDTAIAREYVVTRHVIRSVLDQYLELSRPVVGEIDILCDRGVWAVGMGPTPQHFGHPIEAWAELLGVPYHPEGADSDAQFVLDHWDAIHELMTSTGITSRIEAAARRRPFSDNADL